MTTLLEFTENREDKTNKYNRGLIQVVYSELFTPRQETTEKVLEIGSDSGASTLLWRDYFPNAIITAVNPTSIESLNDQDRIVPILADAYSQEFVDTLEDRSFDIIVVSNADSLESLKFIVNNYLKKIRSNGVLVLENITDAEWSLDIYNEIGPNIGYSGYVDIHDMRKKFPDNSFYEDYPNGYHVITVEKR